MSSQEIKLDAGTIKRKIEQHSPATAEWSAEGTDEAAEVPRLRPPGIDTHAFEPGGEDKLLPAAKPSYPYPVEHSTPGDA